MAAAITQTHQLFKAVASNFPVGETRNNYYNFVRDLIRVRHLYPTIDTRIIDNLVEHYQEIVDILANDFETALDPREMMDTILNFAGFEVVIVEDDWEARHEARQAEYNALAQNDEEERQEARQAEYNALMAQDEQPIRLTFNIKEEKEVVELNVAVNGFRYDAAIEENDKEIKIDIAALKRMFPGKRIYVSMD